MEDRAGVPGATSALTSEGVAGALAAELVARRKQTVAAAQTVIAVARNARLPA
jgi:hypothetical protein